MYMTDPARFISGVCPCIPSRIKLPVLKARPARKTQDVVQATPVFIVSATLGGFISGDIPVV